MAHKQDGLVPVAKVFGGLGGPVKTTRAASPQALHHFTVADQVGQLVAAREADPDLGFMARMMALCSLPRTNPGDRIRYKRVNCPYTLYMTAGGGCKLPFGNFPRLLLAWVSTEAVRTQSRELVLGRSLSEFMRKVGIYSTSGDKHTRLRNQMRRLFGCTVSPLGLDLYLWLTYRTFALKRQLRLTWRQLYRQFGADPAKATEQGTVDNFRRDCLRELKKIKDAWPDLHYRTVKGALLLSPSPPRIPPSQLRLVDTG